MPLVDAPENLMLYRMVWKPEAFDNGELVASRVFSSDDLEEAIQNGTPRFISVDRSDLFEIEIAKDRAAEQQQRSQAKSVEKGTPNLRQEAHNVALKYDSVINCKNEAGQQLFDVCDKSEGSHRAHCGIVKFSPLIPPRKSHLNRLRVALMDAMDEAATHLLFP